MHSWVNFRHFIIVLFFKFIHSYFSYLYEHYDCSIVYCCLCTDNCFLFVSILTFKCNKQQCNNNTFSKLNVWTFFFDHTWFRVTPWNFDFFSYLLGKERISKEILWSKICTSPSNTFYSLSVFEINSSIGKHFNTFHLCINTHLSMKNYIKINIEQFWVFFFTLHFCNRFLWTELIGTMIPF